MNLRLVGRFLGIISMLIGGSMVLSLAWAHPLLGVTQSFEWRGFLAMCGAIAVALAAGAALYRLGRHAQGRLFRKEAMAVVGLSWILATILGAVPYLLSETRSRAQEPRRWDRAVVNAVFESASGFTGTGATVLTDVEDAKLVPRVILFWRSETHFLGGLGIMVLFVALLGQGSAGKSLMRAEMPGPTKDGPQQRTQHAAWTFAAIYLVLTAVLAGVLMIEGLSPFDAFCHAFGTVATGGFSTYNHSIAHFHSVPVEMTITLFMILACTNFVLLYDVVLLRPMKLLGNVEFRTYLAILACATALVVAFGMGSGDFHRLPEAVRFGLFQVTSILTNTGFATCDFDRWNEFSRGILLLLMFVGGCAGSTSCSIKVIRYILLFKIIWLEIERAFRPNVVRPLRLGGEPIESDELRRNVLVYFAMILVIASLSWMAVATFEPDRAWAEASGHPRHTKLVDCASGVAATINGVGPGLGILGPTKNYADLTDASKLLFTWLMMIGRLEIFVILVLFMPSFWRSR